MICAGYQSGTAPATCRTSPGCDLGVLRDACDVCGGHNETCTGCDGVVNSKKILDVCGSCLHPASANFTRDPDDCPPPGCDGKPGSNFAIDACGDCKSRSSANFTTDRSLCPGFEPAVGPGSGDSFPIGAIIGIVAGSVLLLAGGVYWYMRRQNDRMKDDIDSLLKQYLPLDGASASSNGKLMGSSPAGGRDNHSNLRLIGHLDSADEPTDL